MSATRTPIAYAPGRSVWRAVLAYSLLTMVVAFVDPLFIFRADRRCLHDLIAGTEVVAV